MTALKEMLENLAKEGFTVKIRISDGLYLVSVHDVGNREVMAFGESKLFDEAMAEAYENTPKKD
jgi:hypothetical protein